MYKTAVSRLTFPLCTGISRALFYSLIGLTILTVSTSIQADHESEEDLTTLSIEELLEVEVVHNAVSVLTSHIHKQGEWMIGYRYMNMEMEGNRDGTSDVSTASVLTDFAITPTSMRMQSHTMSLMYAPNDDLTVMAMLPYKILSMDHVTRTGVNFTTRAEGIGDLTTLANYVLFRAPQNRHLFTLQGGVSFPTGSIRRERPNSGRPQPETTLSHATGLRDLRPQSRGKLSVL